LFLVTAHHNTLHVLVNLLDVIAPRFSAAAMSDSDEGLQLQGIAELLDDCVVDECSLGEKLAALRKVAALSKIGSTDLHVVRWCRWRSEKRKSNIRHCQSLLRTKTTRSVNSTSLAGSGSVASG